jgi:hypothetical protein
MRASRTSFLDRHLDGWLRYPVMSIVSMLRMTIHVLSFSAVALSANPSQTLADPYFEDGFLGLSQKELHEKLGMPQAVRDRKSALRVFTYYPITDWTQYFSKLVSPENGEDVYTFTRDGVDVRYSFSYAVDPNDHNEDRPLVVRLVDIEFSPAVPLHRIPALVPEFRPSPDPSSPAFRSNIWLLLFKGTPSSAARFIVKEHGKDQFEWTLCYQLFSMQGLPDRLTTNASIDRMEISTQSLQVVTLRQRHTHEPISNPYAYPVRQEALPTRPSSKPIPVPHYAE